MKTFFTKAIFYASSRLDRLWACSRRNGGSALADVHSCKKHTGSTKTAHATILDAVEAQRCWGEKEREFSAKMQKIDTQHTPVERSRALPHSTFHHAFCHQAGLVTERRNIPTIVKTNGKTGQGDLVIKRANIGGDANLIIDVALILEFGGNHMANVSLNGALWNAQPDKLLEAAARTKVLRYREAYATRWGVTLSAPPGGFKVDK